jgi:hypothetical protein
MAVEKFVKIPEDVIASISVCAFLLDHPDSLKRACAAAHQTGRSSNSLGHPVIEVPEEIVTEGRETFTKVAPVLAAEAAGETFIKTPATLCGSL